MKKLLPAVAICICASAGAQNSDSVHFHSASAGTPIYFLNCSQISVAKISGIRPDDIAFINVCNKPDATKRWGRTAKDGAVCIFTKDYTWNRIWNACVPVGLI